MLDVFLVPFSAQVATTAVACARPAIIAAASRKVGSDGAVDLFDLAVTVKNLGSAAEPASLLQSIEIDQDATKVGQVGTPPLRAGASDTVHYRWKRSSEARIGSTRLRVTLVLRDPHEPIPACMPGNATFRLQS